MRNTRPIASPGSSSPPGREPRHERDESEHVTDLLASVGPADPVQGALIAQVAQVRDAVFPLALRGYDREAVDAYVERVRRLVTELEASRSPEAAVRRALERVGEETTGILQRAQQTADEVTERSRASADDRIREAEREARALTEDAEDRVRELEADYGAIWARRDHLLEQVRDLAERLLATADDSADRFPMQEEEDRTEAIEAKTGVLGQIGPVASEPNAAAEGEDPTDFEEPPEEPGPGADAPPGEEGERRSA